MAEQQRAKSEIEAALTIAAARPRDEKTAVDRIQIACQRPTLASKAVYEYSRGGTVISGPTIDLMEVVAQNWGNLEFGFRELARYPGVGGKPGESVVEAFAWDLQTNTRRRTQFTVSHSERTKAGLKVFTDPRDVYEWISNQAQRRVRTCLENIIPRDVVEIAVDECDRTLRSNVDTSPEQITRLVAAFQKIGVTKDAIEAFIQRRVDTITPAQVVRFQKIWASIRDGMSKPEDWFHHESKTATADPPKTAAEQAKEAVKRGRTKSPEKPVAPTPPVEPKPVAEAPEPEPEPEPTPEPETEPDLPPPTEVQYDDAFLADSDQSRVMYLEALDTKLDEAGIRGLMDEVRGHKRMGEQDKNAVIRYAEKKLAAASVKKPSRRRGSMFE